jgi:sortase A
VRNSAEPTTSPKKRKASPLTIIGIALLVAGLGCLGWVAYQYFGTNLTSQHSFSTEKDGLREKWQQEEIRPAAARSKQHQPTRTAARTVPGDAIALLRIPAFGAGYEVPIVSGTTMAALSRGVGYYGSSAMPGQVGNFAIAGHRITHGQPFARLLELTKGDQIIVETRDSIFTYVLDVPPRDLTVKATASWVLDPVPGEPEKVPTRALITLTTCQDLFHSPDRSIAFGHLVSTKNKT